MNSIHDNLQNAFEQALITRNRASARSILQIVEATMSPIEVIDTIITPSLEHIGEEWEAGNLALSQVYMSGRICEDIVAALFPPERIHRTLTPPIAIVVLHDYHILGKRIVASALHAAGYDLLDYGHGIEVDPLIERVKQDSIRILLISTLMLPSALMIQDVSERLKAEDRGVQIIVGGAPFRFDDQLWRMVGADAMGRTASDALGIVGRMLATPMAA